MGRNRWSSDDLTNQAPELGVCFAKHGNSQVQLLFSIGYADNLSFSPYAVQTCLEDLEEQRNNQRRQLQYGHPRQ